MNQHAITVLYFIVLMILAKIGKGTLDTPKQCIPEINFFVLPSLSMVNNNYHYQTTPIGTQANKQYFFLLCW